MSQRTHIYGRLIGHNHVYQLETDTIDIGRDQSCDIVLNSKGISKKHATLRFIGENGERCELYDNNSRNGSYVNGERISSEKHSLEQGDNIRFGLDIASFKFEFTNPKAIARTKPEIAKMLNAKASSSGKPNANSERPRHWLEMDPSSLPVAGMSSAQMAEQNARNSLSGQIRYGRNFEASEGVGGKRGSTIMSMPDFSPSEQSGAFRFDARRSSSDPSSSSSPLMSTMRSSFPFPSTSEQFQSQTSPAGKSSSGIGTSPQVLRTLNLRDLDQAIPLNPPEPPPPPKPIQYKRRSRFAKDNAEREVNSGYDPYSQNSWGSDGVYADDALYRQRQNEINRFDSSFTDINSLQQVRNEDRPLSGRGEMLEQWERRLRKGEEMNARKRERERVELEKERNQMKLDILKEKEKRAEQNETEERKKRIAAEEENEKMKKDLLLKLDQFQQQQKQQEQQKGKTQNTQIPTSSQTPPSSISPGLPLTSPLVIPIITQPFPQPQQSSAFTPEAQLLTALLSKAHSHTEKADPFVERHLTSMQMRERESDVRRAELEEEAKVRKEEEIRRMKEMLAKEEGKKEALRDVILYEKLREANTKRVKWKPRVDQMEEPDEKYGDKRSKQMNKSSRISLRDRRLKDSFHTNDEDLEENWSKLKVVQRIYSIATSAHNAIAFLVQQQTDPSFDSKSSSTQFPYQHYQFDQIQSSHPYRNQLPTLASLANPHIQHFPSFPSQPIVAADPVEERMHLAMSMRQLEQANQTLLLFDPAANDGLALIGKINNDDEHKKQIKERAKEEKEKQINFEMKEKELDGLFEKYKSDANAAAKENDRLKQLLKVYNIKPDSFWRVGQLEAKEQSINQINSSRKEKNDDDGAINPMEDSQNSDENYSKPGSSESNEDKEEERIIKERKQNELKELTSMIQQMKELTSLENEDIAFLKDVSERYMQANGDITPHSINPNVTSSSSSSSSELTSKGSNSRFGEKNECGFTAFNALSPATSSILPKQKNSMKELDSILHSYHVSTYLSGILSSQINHWKQLYSQYTTLSEKKSALETAENEKESMLTSANKEFAWRMSDYLMNLLRISVGEKEWKAQTELQTDRNEDENENDKKLERKGKESEVREMRQSENKESQSSVISSRVVNGAQLITQLHEEMMTVCAIKSRERTKQEQIQCLKEEIQRLQIEKERLLKESKDENVKNNETDSKYYEAEFQKLKNEIRLLREMTDGEKVANMSESMISLHDSLWREAQERDNLKLNLKERIETGVEPHLSRRETEKEKGNVPQIFLQNERNSENRERMFDDAKEIAQFPKQKQRTNSSYSHPFEKREIEKNSKAIHSSLKDEKYQASSFSSKPTVEDEYNSIMERWRMMDELRAKLQREKEMNEAAAERQREADELIRQQLLRKKEEQRLEMIRQKRREEEERERMKREEEEQRRLEEEAEEEERRAKEEEERKRLLEEQYLAREEARRQRREERRRRREEEEKKRIIEEERRAQEKERRRQEAEEKERNRKEEEEREKEKMRRQYEEEERMRKEAEAARENAEREQRIAEENRRERERENELNEQIFLNRKLTSADYDGVGFRQSPPRMSNELDPSTKSSSRFSPSRGSTPDLNNHSHQSFEQDSSEINTMQGADDRSSERSNKRSNLSQTDSRLSPSPILTSSQQRVRFQLQPDTWSSVTIEEEERKKENEAKMKEEQRKWRKRIKTLSMPKMHADNALQKNSSTRGGFSHNDSMGQNGKNNGTIKAFSQKPLENAGNAKRAMSSIGSIQLESNKEGILMNVLPEESKPSLSSEEEKSFQPSTISERKPLEEAGPVDLKTDSSLQKALDRSKTVTPSASSSLAIAHPQNEAQFQQPIDEKMKRDNSNVKENVQDASIEKPKDSVKMQSEETLEETEGHPQTQKLMKEFDSLTLDWQQLKEKMKASPSVFRQTFSPTRLSPFSETVSEVQSANKSFSLTTATPARAAYNIQAQRTHQRMQARKQMASHPPSSLSAPSASNRTQSSIGRPKNYLMKQESGKSSKLPHINENV
ncbi:putative FHA domain [Monocercomonoides exilis]|uniref:putative FHA domain n=1 Tax=Monocercomonoides exilis TaxID=2049356 RepID=UPI003559423C|nr:putative FHA domain [Monocercomonoides exilis]|eukprot:MONOS_4120.1-p1 / transcript=MONOS_4120.1 / gene=MONOS_4120 / organism=Monocercomonoides_exilis_PA203 / gene_product=unspecified product / transcript_product=unspecified product / location=Mono_scaffold00105:71219-77302(+) / protein_length=2027 / sequence_SO=supercontig / SO=protein_coding / is_pseudo=false